MWNPLNNSVTIVSTGLAVVLAGCSVPENGTGPADAGVSDIGIADTFFDAQDGAGDAGDAGEAEVTDGPSSFVPTDIPDLVAWYRADIGITGGTNGVTEWADQSGTGDALKNLTQSNGAQEPTLIASDPGYNGRPTVSFKSTANQVLQSRWAPGSWVYEPFTIIVVGNDDGALANEYYSDGGSLSEVVLAQSSNLSLDYRMDVAGSLGANVAAPITPSSSPRILAGIFEQGGSMSSLFVTAQTPSSTGNLIASVTLTGFTLGNSYGAQGAALNGKIAEAIVYARALQNSEMAAVLAYAGARYSIAVGP